MQQYDISPWQHDHNVNIEQSRAERSTRRVMILTVVMMVVEIAAGFSFGSMALLADGWHMGTHVAAFGIAMFAYAYARRHADNPLFSFGTGKVSVLGGFASAIALAVVALVMAIESLVRLVEPQTIHFNQAIAVAVIGLIVNLASAAILHGGHDDHHHHHDHDDDDDHDHHHEHHHDHNLKAAYLHVLADALTSVLAIVALLAGKYFGWNWLDPVMGIVGAIVIARWAMGLLRETSLILLDSGVDAATSAAIHQAIEGSGDSRIADLHVWRSAPHRTAAMVTVVSQNPQPPEHYKGLLAAITKLDHITVEVHRYLPPEPPGQG